MPVRRVCDCPKPPGGSVACEPQQMPLCIVLNGEARGMCLDPPTPASHAILVDWAMQQITGELVRFQTREAELLMLDRGIFERPDGAVVTFSLPESIRSAVHALAVGALRAQVKEPERAY